MRHVINDQVVLSRPLEGPLSAYIGLFANWGRQQGYAVYSLHRQVLIAACFSRWLGRKGVPLRSISSECAAQYLRYRARRLRPQQGDAAALRHLNEFLRSEGVIPAPQAPPSKLIPVERCAQAFERYLREERALATATIINYVPFIRTFLKDRFGNGEVILSRLSARDVVRFVQRQAPRLHLKRAKLLKICPAPGAALAPEASQAADDGASLLPALRALSGGGHSGFGRSRPSCGELVDDVAPPRDRGGPGSPVTRQYQPTYRDGASRLRYLAPARTIGLALR